MSILATIFVSLIAALIALREWMRRASRFAVSVTAPVHVTLGEQCVIELQVRNEAKRALVLEMVAADDTLTTYLEGGSVYSRRAF